jgi:hypothetical protein
MSKVNRRFMNPLATRPSSAPNSFEEVVRELNLLPEEYADQRNSEPGYCVIGMKGTPPPIC